MNLKFFLPILAFFSMEAGADNSTLDAAIGGAIGGAAGAALGNELGGRSGAIIGGALGASAGTAITTDQEDYRHRAPIGDHYDNYPRHAYPVYPNNINPGYHCPPGQAKKGRC